MSTSSGFVSYQLDDANKFLKSDSGACVAKGVDRLSSTTSNRWTRRRSLSYKGWPGARSCADRRKKKYYAVGLRLNCSHSLESKPERLIYFTLFPMGVRRDHSSLSLYKTICKHFVGHPWDPKDGILPNVLTEWYKGTTLLPTKMTNDKNLSNTWLATNDIFHFTVKC